MGIKQPTPPPVDNSAERQERAQVIIEDAVKRIREMGCTVVAGMSTNENGIITVTLKAVRLEKPTPPPPMKPETVYVKVVK